MTAKNISYIIEISKDDIEGIEIMLKVGARLVNRKAHEDSRATAEKGEFAVTFEEMQEFRKGQRLASQFLNFLASKK